MAELCVNEEWYVVVDVMVSASTVVAMLTDYAHHIQRMHSTHSRNMRGFWCICACAFVYCLRCAVYMDNNVLTSTFIYEGVRVECVK